MPSSHRKFVSLCFATLLACVPLDVVPAQTESAKLLSLVPVKTGERTIRVATFNVSMNRTGPTRLTEDLNRKDAQIQWIATIIRSVKPDIILLNEIDYTAKADNAKLFNELYLSNTNLDQLGNGPHVMPFSFTAPVNTGEPSGLDLNNNGRTDDPEDAWGFGRYPGQYAMAILSRFEIDHKATRTFQNLLWSKLDGAFRPTVPDTGKPYYEDTVWQKLRLPSKSFWDVVVKVQGKQLHLLASHPTPPAFDGPEDRNGCRNQDEIRLLVDYISSSPTAANYFVDDQGRSGLLTEDQNFAIAGDLNADPVDGSNRSEWIHRLLAHPRVIAEPIPQSFGASQAAIKQGQKNGEHKGNSAFDTGDFNDQAVGNLRIDYVLPSKGSTILACGVVWPQVDANDSNRQLIEQINAASDHHMVWVDLQLP